MNYEIICYKRGTEIETNHSPYLKTIQQCESWICMNVKYSETAEVIAVTSRRLVMRFQGMDCVYEA